MADFSLGQAAKRLNLSKPTVALKIRKGLLDGEKQPDGSYRISGAELARFEAEYRKPERGKRPGEKPTDKRDPVKDLQAQVAEYERRLAAIERERAFENDMAEREKAHLERELADAKSAKQELTRDRDQLRRDLASAQERLETAYSELAAITRATVEAGRTAWWQRVLPGKK